MNRSAKSMWNGTIKEGKGNLTTESQTLNKTPYSFVSRFENSAGTNPAELMAAAHAGCFTMKLSSDLTSSGFLLWSLAPSLVSLENGVISKSALTVEAQVLGIIADKFQEIANHA